nr:glycosyltransferase [uncultured bacterium]
MNVVISGWGSSGDVVPRIAVGAAVARRGHHVTFVGNPFFAGHARDAGMAFAPVGTIEDHERLTSGSHGYKLGAKGAHQLYATHYFPHLEGFFDSVMAAAGSGPSVIVGEFGGAVAAEVLGAPLVTVAVSPASSVFARSRHDPPHPERLMPPVARWLARSGRGLALLYGLAALRDRARRKQPAAIAAPGDDHPLLRLRTHAGLPPQTSIRPRLAICLWPDWFAPPQPDWAREAMIAGFPLYPRPTFPTGTAAMSTEVRGDGPIVVTAGTVAGPQRHLYDTAVAACVAIGRPAIMVTPQRSNISGELPSGITHLPYAPYHELFGRASLIVHHGGIGVTSFALAAGVPQIVMPMRGDQYDNGNRLVRLGVARMMSPTTTTPRQLARAIDSLSRSRSVARRCRSWQSRVDPDEGLRGAAEAIERLA